MRIDLTLVASDGTAVDVAVLAPEGTTWRQVRAALGDRWRADPPQWIGGERLRDDAVLGAGALVSGARLTTSRVSPHRNGPHLAIVGGRGAGREIALGASAAVVGRDPAGDVVLTDPQVSRRHAAFRARAHEVEVRDLGSTHGTTLDGRPVSGPTPVPAGSLVRVGNSFLALAGEPPAPSPAVDVVVAAPLAGTHEARPRLHVATALVPAVAGMALAIALHSMLFLLFTALSPVAALAGAVSERWLWRTQRRRSRSREARALAAFETQLAEAVAADTALRRATHPDPAAVVRIATRDSPRLWERAGGRLTVRIGLAELRTRVLVERQGRAEPADVTRMVPVTVDLQAGAIAIVAPRPMRDALARSMVTALAVAHPPSSVELAVVSTDPDRWSWLRWLPHWHGVATAPELLRHARSARRHLIVVVDDGGVDARSLEREQNASAIVLLDTAVTHNHELPQQILMLGDGATARVELADAAIDDVVLDGVDIATADTVARALAPLRATTGSSSWTPGSAALVDVLALDRQSPGADIRDRWTRAVDGLRATLGRDGSGAVVDVDLVADGPHLLVAGTTGSGKSELLQSLVAGLAVRYPPDRVNVLLVDYKGGAAFAACTALPHTVGVVTDLDDHLAQRALASLDSELKRRERVLAATGAADLSELRSTQNPLPRLVIVVDEFATLAAELPDFVSGMVSVARRGRSLGLHLVLATQRPAGVVSAEIRANTALRICLRVTDSADSVDVIGSPDAAAISGRAPGRAYLRAGGDLVDVQVAAVGSVRRSWRSPAPRVVGLDGWRRLPPSPRSENPSDLQRIVAAVTEAAGGLAPVYRPWLDPLPHRLDATELPVAGEREVVVGLLDVPQRQAREPLTVRDGESVLIVGAARSGRTTALRTVATAFATSQPPAQVQLYAIDATGEALQTLRTLPHTATVTCAADGFDATARLVARLAELAGRRRDARPADAVVVLVDGWEQFLAASDTHDAGHTVEAFLALLRDAPAAGMTAVLTGGRAALGSRLAAHTATRLLLALPDPADYLLAGVDRTAVPAQAPGRGVRTADGLEFQFALPHNEIREWQSSQGAAAIRLRALPHRAERSSFGAWDDGRVLLGAGGDDARPIAVDLFAGARRMLVAGPPGSGRSTALCTLLAGLLVTDRRALIVASPRSPLAELARQHDIPVAAGAQVAPAAGTAVLVDDVEQVADTPLGASIAAWAEHDSAGALVVAARTDLLAVTFRGLGADVRAARCGILLQPTSVDGTLLGVRLAPGRPSRIPGRGVLVPDARWQLGREPLPLQVCDG